MVDIRKQIVRIKDRFGREAELHAIESFYLHMDSDGVLTLHGFEKIRGCTDTEITARCADRDVVLVGSGFVVRSLDRSELEISGTVKNISFQKKKQD